MKTRIIPFPVIWLDASTPENSNDYLAGYPPGEERDICCGRSHCRAIEKAGSSEIDFTIILEDDAILHTDFVTVVQELVERWDTVVPSRCGYVSLGWLPVRSYAAYTAEPCVGLRSSPDTTGFVSGIIGLQAYMIRKDVAKRFTSILIHPTYIEMQDVVRSKSFPNLRNTESLVAPDFLFPRIMIPYVLHPPLVIEHPFPSTLGNKNQERYWDKYFAGREELRNLYYQPSSCQIIIICGNEERRRFQEQQMKTMKIPFPVLFLEASTPSNSKDYLVGCTEGLERDTCCSRSHCRAVEQAGLSTAPPFTIILEDDAVLHKDFVSVVLELIERWDTVVKPRGGYASLGWIPSASVTHDVYSKEPLIGLASSPTLRWFDRFAFGLQAYLVPRVLARDTAQIVCQPSLAALKTSILSKQFLNIPGEDHLTSADIFLPRIMMPFVVYPPLAIEHPFPSILKHNNQVQYWDKHFKGREASRLEYYTPSPIQIYAEPEGIQILVLTCSETRRATMKRQLDALALPYPYAFFDGFTPSNSKEYIVDYFVCPPNEKYTAKGETDTTLCCARSHAAILDHFVRDYPNKEYVLILEDDVMLLRKFADELKNVMNLWGSHKTEIDFVSLGYYPVDGKHGSLSSDGPLLWNLDCPNGLVWGAQSYLVHRTVAKDIASVLHQGTTKAMRDAVVTRLDTIRGGRGYTYRHTRLQADNLLSLLWRQALVYPMLAIEAPVESIITPGYINGTNGMWEKVFQQGLRQRGDFYTAPQGVQIVVVTCSATRKAFMKEQLDALALPYSYAFFDGFTPATSKNYMIDRYGPAPEYDTTLCCFRSHVGAIDFFVRTFPEKEYVLLLEDDVALLQKFASELESVMRHWASHKDEIDYVSLGYYPNGGGKHGHRFSDGVLHWGLDCPHGSIWGCQAYIMNRKTASDMASVLHQPTTKAVRESVAKRLATMPGGRGYTKRPIRVQSDNLPGMLWRQGFVYPMMAIEAPLESIISPGYINGTDGLWNNVFQEGRRRDEFYTPVDVDPFAGATKILIEPFCTRS